MIGQIILHYKIIEKLGEGGMGIVYKAEDIKLKRTVALKFLPSYALSSKEDLARFNQEAQAAALLNHPNICTVYAIEEDKTCEFISMEYVDGITLGRKISGSPLKTDEAIAYAIQIGEALQEAHCNGIIHRDIKSENIMINSKNQIKVMDFGLAKLKGSLKLSNSSSTAGTLSYMAPEQIRGADVDARSDIFSFGVVLYEMLTGNLPFRGVYEASIMYSIVNEEPEPLQKYLPDANSELVHIVNRALEKDPEDRYQSLKDIVIDLRRMQKHTAGNVSVKLPAELSSSPVKEKPVTEDKSTVNPTVPRVESPAAQKTKARTHYSKKLILGLSALVIILLLVIGGVLFFSKSSEPVIGKSVAVLPFKNLNPDKTEDYFSDGITEDITVELSQIGDLKVIARNSVMQYKNSDAAIKEIGSILGVSSILQGSIQKEGNQVRIFAQLIDVNTGKYLWAGSYNKELTKIFAIQSDVARQIAGALKMKLTPDQVSRMDKNPTDNIAAYQFYLKGRDYYDRYNKDANENAIALFKEALALDSNYALAYAGLGDCYGQRVGKFGFPEEWADSAVALSMKSIALDPGLAEGYKALGLAQTSKGMIKAALDSYNKALKLNPSYSPAVTNTGYCNQLLGNLADAVPWMKKSCELEPAVGIVYVILAEAYLYLLDYTNAEKNLNIALNLQPDLAEAYRCFAKLHFNQGNYQQMLKDCEKILSLDPDNSELHTLFALASMNLGDFSKAEEALKKVPQNSSSKNYSNCLLAYINKKKNNLTEVNNIVKQTKKSLEDEISKGDESYGPALDMFLINIVAGDKKEAYKWFNKAVDLGFRDFMSLLNNPITEEIRNEKEFQDIIQTIKDKVKEQQNLLASNRPRLVGND